MRHVLAASEPHLERHDGIEVVQDLQQEGAGAGGGGEGGARRQRTTGMGSMRRVAARLERVLGGGVKLLRWQGEAEARTGKAVVG